MPPVVSVWRYIRYCRSGWCLVPDVRGFDDEYEAGSCWARHGSVDVYSSPAYLVVFTSYHLYHKISTAAAAVLYQFIRVLQQYLPHEPLLLFLVYGHLAHVRAGGL